MTNPAASQGFGSRFGTYRPGDSVDPYVHPDALNAWLAAGIVVEAGADKDATPAPTEPQRRPDAPDARPAPPERPRRFVEDAAQDTPRHRRFERSTTGPGSDR